jgi:hypothetical protein
MLETGDRQNQGKKTVVAWGKVRCTRKEFKTGTTGGIGDKYIQGMRRGKDNIQMACWCEELLVDPNEPFC